jgi:dTDP-4-amino-4,6-dideoxygalactose transaminase
MSARTLVEPAVQDPSPPIRTVPFFRFRPVGREAELILEVLESGWLTTGRMAMEFESRFAAAVGAKHALAVNSCTAALHLALEALGVGPGQSVLVPSMTFTATAEVVRYLGADVIVTDVDRVTRAWTPEILDRAAAAYPEARYCMPMHYGGHPAPMLATGGVPGLLDVAKERNLTVIEDAAHAFPARLAGKCVGSFGRVTCFSFYANKTITTGEGGMLVTDDDAIAARCRIMRVHGIDRDVWKRFTTPGTSWDYDVVAPGYKYNMPDLNAAIGLAQLECAEELRRGRQAIAEAYLRRLADIDAIELPTVTRKPEDHAWHLFPIAVRDGARLDRNGLSQGMATAGIGVSVHYRPLHRMTYWRDRYGLRPEDFPGAESAWQRSLSIPIFAGMTEQELDHVCDTLHLLLS